MRVFDIESDGLLPGVNRDGEMLDDERTITKVHCINGFDRRTGREHRFTDYEFYYDLDGNVTDVPTKRCGTIADGLKWLEEAECIAGHNIIGYDIPALEYIYPEFTPPKNVFDSQVMGKLAVPDLKAQDFGALRKGKLDKGFVVGSQKLKHWAMRVGKHLKDEFDPADYGHTWKTMPFTDFFDTYCMHDVEANVDVIEWQEQRLTRCPDAVELEHAVAPIIKWQERVGIRYDREASDALAANLYAKLHELEAQSREQFAPFYLPEGGIKKYKSCGRKFVVNELGRDWHKIGGKKQKGFWCHHTDGGHQPIKLQDFNPGSARHVSNRLTVKYGWEPTEFTDSGLARIDEDVLDSLPFPEAKVIGEYKMVQKRLAQLAEGKQAWIKTVKEDGRIYGRVDQLGTGTGRMSHFGPNLAQVPANYKPYGAECRALFTADPGRVLLGCDADALELRILAHFLAIFDGGEYVETVLNGSKADGTDMHSRNKVAVGLEKRDTAKTWFYAFIYGAGDFKLGTIVLSEWDTDKLTNFYDKFPPGRKRKAAIVRLGKRSRGRLEDSIPAFKRLVDSVRSAAERGFIFGLDKRRVPIRALHSALNFLCQGAGAIVMKRALVIMFEDFCAEGLDVVPLLNVHDEVQLSVLQEQAKRVGEIAADAIRKAGEYYNLRCPLAGDYDIGANWSETH